jgi:uncharacterized protein (DUF3084 family)
MYTEQKYNILYSQLILENYDEYEVLDFILNNKSDYNLLKKIKKKKEALEEFEKKTIFDKCFLFDENIDNKNSTMQNKNNTMQNKNNTMQSKDSTIQSKDSTIQSKDSTIQSKDSTIQSKDSTIQNKIVIKKMKQDISKLEEYKKTKNENINIFETNFLL